MITTAAAQPVPDIVPDNLHCKSNTQLDGFRDVVLDVAARKVTVE